MLSFYQATIPTLKLECLEVIYKMIIPQKNQTHIILWL